MLKFSSTTILTNVKKMIYNVNENNYYVRACQNEEIVSNLLSNFISNGYKQIINIMK